MNNKTSSKLHTLKNTGFTLVELVVSMTLTAIFATAIVAILPAATRIYMQVENMSRAQLVADMVIDALREECADTYIDDFASVRIVSASPNPDPSLADVSDITESVNSDGDKTLISSLANTTPSITPENDPPGNVLIIKKSTGYCEAIFSDIAISHSNFEKVWKNDKTRNFDELGVSTRAVYRFFLGENISDDIRQGYVHYGYYQCETAPLAVGNETINCIFPNEKYDYTVPFQSSAYNGYTISLSFSNLDYCLAPGETDDNLLTRRPCSVEATVKVYSCSYADQSSSNPVYTRTAILIFDKDSNK